MTQYILGIDGGATTTRAVILDESGRLYGAGLGGPSYADAGGVAIARTGIQEAVTAALQTADLKSLPFASAFLGLAGVVSAKDEALVREIAHDLELAPPERIGIGHDIRIALAGGLTGRPGIALIAGTGSSCYGMNAGGKSWKAGGWGGLLADEGSSYWLGVQAMTAAVRAFDGRISHTTLLESVQRELGLVHINDIVHRLYVTGMSRPEIAALAPVVIEAARVGDPVALALIQRGTQDLADCVLAVAKHLGMTAGVCELVLVGGLFRAGGIYIEPLQKAVLERLPHCHITLPELPPTLGACLLALQQLGITIDDAITRALRLSKKKLES